MGVRLVNLEVMVLEMNSSFGGLLLFVTGCGRMDFWWCS